MNVAEPKSVEFSKINLDLYESNASSKLVRKRERTALYGDVDEVLYEWYLVAVFKNIYPDGTQLIFKAKKIANPMMCTNSRDQMGGWKNGSCTTTSGK